jgi:cytochrome c oxidase assembly factor CtaG
MPTEVQVITGAALILFGIFFVVCATMKSENIVYKMFYDRSEMCWKKHTYRFHQISGFMMVLFGCLEIAGIFGSIGR